VTVSAPLLPGKPARPKSLLILAASLFVGITLGSGIALLADLTDKRIVSLRAFPVQIGKAPVGVLSEMTASELSQIGGSGASGFKLAVYRLPRSRYVEDIRSLASALFMSRVSGPAQVITISSPAEHEGKTTLSANLAVILAQQGKRVLLVDANFRNPNVHSTFKLDNATGLAALIANHLPDPRVELRAIPEQPGLSALAAGPMALLPAEAFSLPVLGEILSGLRKHFDCIILDAGAVLGNNDAVALAAQSDLVLLVSWLGVTKSQELLDSISKLEHVVSADSLKLVINGAVLAPGTRAVYYGDAK
jgi:capsular exopolysaccharide synthesis family protein